jgi:RecA/RadA recombinase
MVNLANAQPEIRALNAANEFEDLGEPVVTEEVEATEDGHDRFRVIPADEFAVGRPMEWVVRGVLPRAELAVIYGESGSGKSFLTLDLCAAISRGLAWRDRSTMAGRCVYVCAEGAGGFRSRLRAYALAKSVELHELPAVIADAPNLLEVKDAVAITRSILAWGKVDVIVIDTLSATTPGGNENSGEDMGRVLSHCKAIHKKTGALVVLIHHSGKDATRGARGWSGLRAAADAEMEVTRSGDFRAVTITKMKDGTDGQAFGFKLKSVVLGLTEDGEESSCVIEHTELTPANKKWRPQGANQKAIWKMLEQMSVSGEAVDENKLLDAVIESGGDKDESSNVKWRGNLAIAVRTMASEGHLHRHDGMVSFINLKVANDTGYLE